MSCAVYSMNGFEILLPFLDESWQGVVFHAMCFFVCNHVGSRGSYSYLLIYRMPDNRLIKAVMLGVVDGD